MLAVAPLMLLTNYIKGYVTRTPVKRPTHYLRRINRSWKTLIEEIFPMHAKRIAEAFEQLSSEELTLLQKLYEK